MVQGTMVKIYVCVPPLILGMGLLFSHRLVLTLQKVAPCAQIRDSQYKSPQG